MMSQIKDPKARNTKCSKLYRTGGGVQSTGLLVLAAQGKIDFKTFLFCNVGDDSENPDTITYVNEVAIPYAKDHGIEIIELQKVLRSGETDTLYKHLTKTNSKSIEIPVRMSNGAPGNRSCTADFKVLVVDKWLRQHGGKIEQAQVGLGISLDEFQRVKPNMDPATMKWKENVFPLIDLRMDRQQCMNVIQSAGLPVPPKSSCYFCPFHRMEVWQEMRQKQPDLFWKAANLEETLNERRASLGKDKVWLSRKLIPLAMATTSMIQGHLFEEDNDDVCESGYCMM